MFYFIDGGAQEAAVPEEESWQSAPSYDHENITNADDFAIYDQLDEAQENLNVVSIYAILKFIHFYQFIFHRNKLTLV